MISEFGVEHLRAGEKRGLQKESIKNKEQAIEEALRFTNRSRKAARFAASMRTV